MARDAAQEFAANVRRERERQGLSKSALARVCGMYTSEITRLEAAERDPRLSTIVRIAHGLGVSASDLLKGIR
jgi:transcriptional regulator with XRE-family HTH domain